jgi:hypothetical protein
MPLAIAIGALYLLRFTLAFMLMDVSKFQAKYAKPGIITSLKDIMYGLIYPAVLGTGLVLAVLRATKEPSAYSRLHDPSLYIAVASGAFYVLSFTAPFEMRADKLRIAYRWPAFLIDWCEVALMFLCFYYLGLLDDKVENARLSPAYACLFVDVILIQPLWRLMAGVYVYTEWQSRLVVAVVLAGGMITGLFGNAVHPWIDAIASLLMFGFVAKYVKDDSGFWQDDSSAAAE